MRLKYAAIIILSLLMASFPIQAAQISRITVTEQPLTGDVVATEPIQTQVLTPIAVTPTTIPSEPQVSEDSIAQDVIENSEDIAEDASTMELSERLIVEDASISDVKSLETEGCRIRHKLEGATSFECPKSVSKATISNVNAEPVEMFHILDLNAASMINADDVWTKGYDGSGINIVIIDTGIDASHIELQNALIGQYDFVGKDSIANDENGHGTMVAGMITGDGTKPNAKGIAPKAKIYMLKVCDAKGVCKGDDIIAAMEYAKGLNAKIVSMSIGSDNEYQGDCDYSPLAKKANELSDAGFIVVAASGNAGYLGTNSPACASKSVSVGSVYFDSKVTWFSSRGSSVDILAPGAGIYAPTKGGSYSTMSGTSASTPQVSGAIALLWQAKPSATKAQILSAIYSTGKKPTNCERCTSINAEEACVGSLVSEPCSNVDKTNGVIDANAALVQLIGSQPQGDADGDGVSDSNDACPNEYGKACNGCANKCTGCAAMQCSGTGKPTCAAGGCAATTCASDGCGIGGCASNQMANFPASEPNTCTLSGSNGVCTQNTCKATCKASSDCDGTVPPEGELCWAGANKYIKFNQYQLKKFCDCAAGSYSYLNYKRVSTGYVKAYKYKSIWNDNKFLRTQVSVYNPVNKVMCKDRYWYNTDQNYYN